MSLAETGFCQRLGAAIRTRRVALGIPQTSLGRSTGVTFQQVQKYERGLNHLTVDRLVLLAAALGTTPAELIAEATGQEVSVSPAIVGSANAAATRLAQHFLGCDETARAVISAIAVILAKNYPNHAAKETA